MPKVSIVPVEDINVIELYGTAGIGCEMLRLASPDRIHSLL